MYNISPKLYTKYLYPNQLYKKFKKNKKKEIFILVNHSGDENNNHLELLRIMKKFKNKKIKVFLPLAYGEYRYIKKVEREYKKIFKNKCVVIKKKLSFYKYLKLLSNIDIAIFNHTIQAAKNTKFFLFANQTQIFLNENDDLRKEFDRIKLKYKINTSFNLKNENLYINFIRMNKEISKNKLKKDLEYYFNLELK